MSELWTLNRICPFLTSSPNRALISTTRPVASDGTGTLRETSGLTTPVTFNSGAEACGSDATTGNWSGWSTFTRLASSSCSTLAAGGSSDLASAVTFWPHPASIVVRATHDSVVNIKARFMELPHGPLRDSVDSLRSSTNQSGSNSSNEY